MENQFEQIESERGWKQLFETIRSRSSWHDGTTKEAKKIENKDFNRYRDVSPYDHSRVILSRSENDYINASRVLVPQVDREYILTQGPLVKTIGHFWLMVWEQHTKGIVMLNKLIEKNMVKCDQYWPNAADSVMNFEELKLSVQFISESQNECCSCRTFKLTDHKSNSDREIIQFHYTNWPDFGVPRSPQDFLDFLECVRRSGILENNVGPAIVHCSAGIGRSGTFCLVESVLKMIEDSVVKEDEIKLDDILLEMRRYRMSLIQTAEQLRFSYLAIIEAFRRLHDKSPYLGEKDDDTPPPPPPPHRSKPVPIVPLKTSSSSSEDDNVDEWETVSKANNSSPDICSEDSESSDSNDEDDSQPPPLPPKDIPSQEVSENNDKTVESDLTDLEVSEVNAVLDSFEEKILATERMIQTSLGEPTEPKQSFVENPAEESEMILRKRQRDQKLIEQIKSIKKGIQDSNAAHQRKALIDKVGLSFIIVCGAGLVMYKLIDYIRS